MDASDLKERLSKVEECLRKLARYVAEMVEAMDGRPPADSMMEEVAAARAAQEKWRSEVLDEKCPRCGSPRIRKVDLETGEEFVGCSAYPACRWRQRRRTLLKRKVAAVVEASRNVPQDLSRLPF